MAIIPQEALLFNGTIRTNLVRYILLSPIEKVAADTLSCGEQDPLGVYDDVKLNDALRCAYLTGRYTLDTKVEDEGSNFSVGERSLVSLARALVKDSRIVVCAIVHVLEVELT